MLLTQSKILLLWTLLSALLILSGYFDKSGDKINTAEFAIAAFYSFIMGVPRSLKGTVQQKFIHCHLVCLRLAQKQLGQKPSQDFFL